jgi:hypothetical protein
MGATFSHQPPLIYCFVGTLQISLVLAEGTAKTVMPRFLQLQSKGAFRRIHKAELTTRAWLNSLSAPVNDPCAGHIVHRQVIQRWREAAKFLNVLLDPVDRTSPIYRIMPILNGSFIG